MKTSIFCEVECAKLQSGGWVRFTLVDLNQITFTFFSSRVPINSESEIFWNSQSISSRKVIQYNIRSTTCITYSLVVFHSCPIAFEMHLSDLLITVFLKLEMKLLNCCLWIFRPLSVDSYDNKQWFTENVKQNATDILRFIVFCYLWFKRLNHLIQNKLRNVYSWTVLKIRFFQNANDSTYNMCGRFIWKLCKT